MRISYNWLKDYVDIKLPPEKLAEILTMSGLSVDSIDVKGDDSVLEAEITSNRPDWLSYIGVAREVAAITGAKLKLSSFVYHRSYIETHRHSEARRAEESKKRSFASLRMTNNERLTTIPVKVLDKKLCPRYTARVIRNVKVGESPTWLKKRIETAGLRPVNNIVDITNFCLLETGEPMHAFDLDKLAGGSVIVRNAMNGEKITAIDGVERTLDSATLVIADDKRPVAIAGVMGGSATEVGISTKNILLEAAYFDPISIRRTSRRLALSTESSYRFERKVDVENIISASDRATQLIMKLANGKPCEFLDIGKTKPGKKIVPLRLEKLNKVLGVEIPPTRVKAILISLGLKVRASSKTALKLEIPQFRYDLQNEIDLIEEVARIYGYDRIDETLPAVVETGQRLPEALVIEERIRRTLQALGLSEIITYGLMARKLLSLAKIPDDDVVDIRNPLSAEQEIMRPTLIIGLLNSIRWNINRRNKDLKLFESGKIYLKNAGNNFTETKHLSLGITGQSCDGWMGHPRPITFFDLKGIVQTLFSELGIKALSMKVAHNDIFSPAACASIDLNGDTIGIIGQIEPKILQDFYVKDAIYACEIDCEKLAKHISLEKRFEELPKYPSIVRDISIMANVNILNDQILSAIREASGNILKDVRMIDRYSGGQIPDGKTGLTYRLEYQDPKRTLEEKDVQEVHSRILRALESNLGARLR